LDNHDRASFRCDVPALDGYFRDRASQDMRRRIAVCLVACERATGRIAGFYTLSAADIPLTGLPDAMAKRMPRYPALTAARIGRLAVDQDFRGQKLGSALLADAVLRVVDNNLGAFALVVDAKDEPAAAFYRHHGFVHYGSAPHHLIAGLSTLLAGR